MDDLIDIIEYKNYKIKTYHDFDPESPREWDSISRMICFHSGYNLGDAHTYDNPVELFSDLLQKLPEKVLIKELSLIDMSSEEMKEMEADPIGYIDNNFYNNSEDFDFLYEILQSYYIFLPIYLYDHSGITINTTGFSCPWDSGQVGFIYMSYEEAKDNFGNLCDTELKKKAEDILRSEVNIYDNYIRGDVYGYMIEQDDIDIVDSCWGFYEYDYMVDVAKDIIDYIESKESLKNKQIKKE